MHRFYYPNLAADSTTITLSDTNEIHHLKNVLRLKTGDAVTLFNGRGEEAVARITSLEATNIRLRVETMSRETARKVSVILACAVPKKAKFETIIEKCTELGVDEILPLKTKRTELKTSENILQKKSLRYERVAVNAAKQSSRKTVPLIRPITQFTEAFKLADKDTVILFPCLFGQRKSIRDALESIPKTARRILVFIGPEGDFTEEEARLAIQNGALPVSLGPTILKVDTAACSVIAAINFFLDANG